MRPAVTRRAVLFGYTHNRFFSDMTGQFCRYNERTMVNMHLTGGRERAVAVVDVSPGSASVAVLSVSGHSPANIIATGHSKLTLEERTFKQATAQIGGQIQEAGKEALDAYTKNGHRTPIDSVYIVVHAPWATTQTIRMGEKYGSDEVIRDAMVGKLAQQALANAPKLDRARLLEASVLRVQLNGYSTVEPAGKYAHAIDIVSLVSECDPAVRSAISAGVGQVFPVAKPAWRSGIRSLMMLARESAVPSRHYLIVDMGVDTTHVISVRGAAFEQRVVPEGVRTILSRIAGGKPPEDVLTSLRMLERDACSTEACEAVQKALVLAEPELVRIFADPIGQMAATRRAANDLLLVTHPDLEPWLGRLFSRIDFSQFTVTTLPFTVCTPSSMHVDRWISGGVADDSLAVASALVPLEAAVTR